MLEHKYYDLLNLYMDKHLLAKLAHFSNQLRSLALMNNALL